MYSPWQVKSVPAASKPRRTLPNLKLVAFWLMQRAPDEQLWVEAATTVHPQVAAVEQMAQQFRLVFRERNPEAFKSWLARGMESEIPEVKSFVAGIQRGITMRCWRR
jgi:transposase